MVTLSKSFRIFPIARFHVSQSPHEQFIVWKDVANGFEERTDCFHERRSILQADNGVIVRLGRRSRNKYTAQYYHVPIDIHFRFNTRADKMPKY